MCLDFYCFVFVMVVVSKYVLLDFFVNLFCANSVGDVVADNADDVVH